MFHLLVHLGWVDLCFECSAVCPILPGLMVIWQERFEHLNQSQPCARADEI